MKLWLRFSAWLFGDICEDILFFVLQKPQALWLSRREEKLFTVLIFLSEKESLSWGQSYLADTIRRNVFMTVCNVRHLSMAR